MRAAAFCALVLVFGARVAAAGESTPARTPRYETRAIHDPDGIGRFYMGREIALVMGHTGADWLERPDRDREERPDLLMKVLQLKPGQVVADIGAGTGYYTRRLAKAAGPSGLVYAVDVQREMLDLLTNKMAALGLRNVRAVLGMPEDPKLPAAKLDLILMVDVYHEFDHPFEMMRRICEALKPGGRVVFVEFRAEDPAVAIKPLHKMTEAQVRREMAVQPLRWVRTSEVMPEQHIIIFRKAAIRPSGP